MPNYVERVAARAEQIKFIQLVLTVLALPFFIVGVIVGVVWLAVRWCYAAVIVGFETSVKRDDDAG